jgi:hypothetical protein
MARATSDPELRSADVWIGAFNPKLPVAVSFRSTNEDGVWRRGAFASLDPRRQR